MFNRRYFRSSYNQTVFYQAVPLLLDDPKTTLNSLFSPVFPPNFDFGDYIIWTSSDIDGLINIAVSANEIAERLKNCDKLVVSSVNSMISNSVKHFWQKPPNRDEALSWVRSELAEFKDYESYSAAKGAIFADGITIVGVVSSVSDFMSEPKTHLVYRMDDEVLQTYVDSAKIVAEFCEEAISLIESDGSCVVSWSG